MGSPFFYRLRTVSAKKGQALVQNVIPVYAFKGGDLGGSAWYTGGMNLDVMRMLALGSDGARMMTVCTDLPYAYRAIEDKEVSFFELHVKDTRVAWTDYSTERKTVATISCKDMTGGKRVPVDRSNIKMSCEPLSNLLVAVTLAFFDYEGGPIFTYTY